MRTILVATMLMVLVGAGCTVTTSTDGHSAEGSHAGHDHGAPTSRHSAAIVARSEAWEAAFQASDLEALVTFYTEDARFLPPNAELVTGHEGVRAVMGEMTGAKMGGTMTLLETVEVGDVGYNVGTFTLENAEGEVVDRGKFIEIWRLVDGEWKISADMFNSDLPADHGHDR